MLHNIPCSCGGILESLGWREHLYFNLAFIALAVLALINTLHHIATAIFNKAQYRIFLISITGVLSAAATLKKNGKKRLEKLPLVVNKTAAIYQNSLFINSKIPGKNDNEKLRKQASVIDVYNIEDGSYRFSFPLYDINGRKMDSFKVYQNKIFLINENWMVQYDLNPKVSGLP